MFFQRIAVILIPIIFMEIMCRVFFKVSFIGYILGAMASVFKDESGRESSRTAEVKAAPEPKEEPKLSVADLEELIRTARESLREATVEEEAAARDHLAELETQLEAARSELEAAEQRRRTYNPE